MHTENLELVNCNVYSVRQEKHTIQDIYISGGQIVDSRPVQARTIDMGGACVYCGFVDSHAHLLGTGMIKGSADLSEIRSLEDLEKALKSSVPVLVARGWDDDKLSFIPNRAMIDRITQKPAILYRRCGHVAVVNSAAIERFSLTDLDEMDGSSLKTGLLKERALNSLSNRIELTKTELEAFVELGIQEFISNGITSVHSDDMGSFNDKLLIDVIRSQRNLRVFEKVKMESEDDIELFKLVRESSNSFFTAGAIKIYLDGSLGARTAALLEPYSDDPMNCGMLYMDTEQLESIVEIAEKKSIQVCAHTIGDRSMEVALKGFRRTAPGNPLKHRLIHVQTANPDQLDNMRKLSLRASIQPLFFFSDSDIVVKRLGEARLPHTYPYAEMENKGIRFALSSDSPVESVSIFRNLSAADRFFDRTNSIRYYTVEGNDLEGNSRYGELGPGNAADLIAVSVDLVEADSRTLNDAEVLMTIVAGRIVFSR